MTGVGGEDLRQLGLSTARRLTNTRTPRWTPVDDPALVSGWLSNLAVQDRELMTEHQDLHVPSGPRATQQHQPVDQTTSDQAFHTGRRSSLVVRPVGVLLSGPHTGAVLEGLCTAALDRSLDDRVDRALQDRGR